MGGAGGEVTGGDDLNLSRNRGLFAEPRHEGDLCGEGESGDASGGVWCGGAGLARPNGQSAKGPNCQIRKWSNGQIKAETRMQGPPRRLGASLTEAGASLAGPGDAPAHPWASPTHPWAFPAGSWASPTHPLASPTGSLASPVRSLASPTHPGAAPAQAGVPTGRCQTTPAASWGGVDTARHRRRPARPRAGTVHRSDHGPQQQRLHPPSRW